MSIDWSVLCLQLERDALQAELDRQELRKLIETPLYAGFVLPDAVPSSGDGDGSDVCSLASDPSTTLH